MASRTKQVGPKENDVKYICRKNVKGGQDYKMKLI